MAFWVVGSIMAVASAQTTRTVRVVEYNIQADTTYTIPTCGLIVPFTGTGGSFTTSCGGSATTTNGGVLEGIGEEIINGDPAQPIDILALNETTSNTTTVQPIVNGLNAFYLYYNSICYTNHPAGYAMSTYQATESGGSPSSGNGPNALVYNTNTLQLLASVPVDPPGGTGNLGSTSGEYREVMRYEFAPAGVTPGTNNEFYVYVSHYKASSGSSDDKARFGEASIIRSNEYLNLPANARVLYVGDYNPDDNSGEAGYQTICSNGVPGIANSATGQGQGVDPLNILWTPYTSASPNINWSVSTTNTNILFMMSEESYELRYRDDLQVMTSNVYYDVAGGFQYVPGTYHSFGNNGSFTWGTSVNSGGNTALSDLDTNLTKVTGLSAAVLLEDLTGASDHLPTVADYTIPIPLSVTAPVASFTNNPASGPVPLTVHFYDTSTGSPTSWSWTFGDGSGTSTSQNPNYTYNYPGSYVVTQIVANASGSSTNHSTITASCPAITLSPAAGALTAGTVGTAYSQTITASGGTGPYTYAVTAGSLTGSGLSLSSAGTLSGASPVAGTYTFTVTATDTNNCTGSAAYTLTVGCPTITLSPNGANPTALPGGTEGTAYNSQTITASGGTGPYTYAVTAGSLAGSGLSLSSAGVLSGPSPVAGTYTFTVTATDTNNCTSSQAYSVTVQTQFGSWEQFYDLSGTLSGGNASYTGDGMSNTNKFMAGFNPTNAAAYLHVISIVESVAGNTNVVVTYLGANGDNTYVPGIASRTNVLDYMTGDANGSYTNGGWQDTGQTNILSGGNGSGIVTNMTDSNVTASPNLYYRVRVLLP
ncbi:MAG: putative Ig domain-containing protein [Verrucomicrobiia bacterium]|jgi:PKD repeat protein